MIGDARRVSREIDTSRSSNDIITEEQLYNCVGLERLVTRGMAKYVEETKRAHVESILEEQRIQKERGLYDMERLSMASKKNSQWTAEVARKLATDYKVCLRG